MRRVLSETPQISRYPGDGADRQASNRRAPSSGESHVVRPRGPSGNGGSKHEPIRITMTSMPNREWYRLPSASIAALLTPLYVSGRGVESAGSSESVRRTPTAWLLEARITREN